ncbi:MAG: SecD/SecF family protein translocase subunit, partial [Proteobacteria bacterium]|nr:SecD/SecF family protein translocase subunit [Pseudomonadota bacterium]
LKPKPISEMTVSPTMGQDVRTKGVNAIRFAAGGVFLFMIAYYLFAGIIADLCLGLNLILVMGSMALIDATFTLPGIAGIILTIGMSVDANVLIFERIREELRNGNSPQASITAGYGKAFSSIVDANVTTLIAAVVLFTFGTGAIRGFAVTLSLGILTSMFTAIVGTRALINVIYGRRQHLDKLSI